MSVKKRLWRGTYSPPQAFTDCRRTFLPKQNRRMDSHCRYVLLNCTSLKTLGNGKQGTDNKIAVGQRFLQIHDAERRVQTFPQGTRALPFCQPRRTQIPSRICRSPSPAGRNDGFASYATGRKSLFRPQMPIPRPGLSGFSQRIHLRPFRSPHRTGRMRPQYHDRRLLVPHHTMGSASDVAHIGTLLRADSPETRGRRQSKGHNPPQNGSVQSARYKNSRIRLTPPPQLPRTGNGGRNASRNTEAPTT